MYSQCGLRMYLRQAYGEHWTNIVLDFLNCVKKHANLICQFNFLETCKRHRILPPSLRFNLHLGTHSEGPFIQRMGFKTLTHILKDHRSRRYVLSNKILNLKSLLYQILSPQDFQQILQMSHRSFRHISHLAKTRLSEKFSKLEFQQFQQTRIFLPRFCPGPPLENLSSKVFTSKELSILSKGPKFAMAQTHVNTSEIITGVESAILSSHGEVENPDLLRGEIVKSILDYRPSLSLSTQSKEEIKILRNLKKDKNTVITKADKGNTVVIMNSADYELKVNTLLMDKNIYKEINFDPTDKYTQKLRNELGILKDTRLITPQMYRKFYPKGCSAPKFYGLPKIHKKDIPLRPIVACYSSPATGIGSFLATIFKPLLSTQKSYIKNSIDLVKKLKNQSTTENTVLSSFDAVSMYTSCDVHKCEQALQRKLEENSAWSDYKTLEIDTIMTLVRLCNKYSSYFKFRNKFFLQIMGLSMGTVLSPYLANFYMDFIEQSALNSFHLKHSIWFRFVDDILSVWEHGQDSLRDFLAHLNSFDSNLQFTMELEDSGKLPFLDVLIIKTNPSLEFSIYRKPTHNDRYLHFSSHHPPSVKRGVIISLVDRVLKICSRNHINSELNYVKDILFCNGYPIKLIENIIDRRLKKIKEQNRELVPLDSVTPAIEKKTFIVLPYIPKLGDKLGKILKKHNLSVSFKTEQKVEHFFNSGKDKTDPVLGSGVYRNCVLVENFTLVGPINN